MNDKLTNAENVLLDKLTYSFILLEKSVIEYFDCFKPAYDYSCSESGSGYEYEHEVIDCHIYDTIAFLRSIDPNWWADEIDEYIYD